jgi:hypothetical protein
MAFFDALTVDLKVVVVAMAAVLLLALFSGNRKNEKRYFLLLAVLTAVGVYRFMQTDVSPADQVITVVNPKAPAPEVHKPIVSTAAK